MNRSATAKFSLLFWTLVVATIADAQQTKKNTIAVTEKRQDGSFPLVAGGRVTSVFYSSTEEKVVRIAAQTFCDDVRMVAGISPRLDSSDGLRGSCIIIGTIGKNKLVDALIGKGKLDASKVNGQWESFTISVIARPFHGTEQALVIAGSDPRGTAYGVFELSKMIGVAPFYWWADINPEHKKEIFLSKGDIVAGPPSVKYRGIFINDEDWGLQPWAAKTFEPETGDIGPKTYAKVFELLLRLKANLIWPAMHPSTKAFFHYPGNAKVAADYSIIIGSSHAEPMLRNNVSEWNEKTMGHFNYVSNKENVYKYWEDRVKQSAGINGMYTMGMRGVHDSKMEGVKDEKEAVPLLERIIADQRDLLSRYLKKDVTAIPQVFTAYKEVLDIYDAGLKLPEDITLVWPDDNYGYIQRLNNENEKTRTGGSGVYYHASYWGRPHDYLWLSSTHPSLIREEMMKAFENDANRLWVLNVGDIKPLEYNIELFMDMAYDAKPFKDSRYVKTHLSNWATNTFGKANGHAIEKLLWQYYQLAFERKPEFMGWSQTEPTTKTNLTTYNHFFYGDEAQRRIDQYEKLEKEARALRYKISSDRKDAFYELVYYPVMGTSWINKKFLYRDKALLYSKQNRLSSIYYASLSSAAYDSILKETEFYNTKLAGGKWNGMMSMKPRNLPVFQLPELSAIEINKTEGWSVAPEGFVRKDSTLLQEPNSMDLPVFDNVHKQHYFIDVFLAAERSLSWTATVSHPWIRLSQNKGVLQPSSLKSQVRLQVSMDWIKAPKQNQFAGQIVFKGGGKQIVVEIKAQRFNNPELISYKGFVENNGFVGIHASHFSFYRRMQRNQWKVVEGLGYTGSVLQSQPQTGEEADVSIDTPSVKNKNAYAAYDFFTFTSAPASITIFTLPTHPLNNKFSMRYAVSVDDGPLQVIDFKTFGRSEEWKQNVLSNRAWRKIQIPFLNKGNHVLKIYAIDPGVMLDEIRIDMGALKKAYGMLAETRVH